LRQLHPNFDLGAEAQEVPFELVEIIGDAASTFSGRRNPSRKIWRHAELYAVRVRHFHLLGSDRTKVQITE
jgi:hypothetical protein